MTRTSLLKTGVTTLAALGLAASIPAHAQTPYFVPGNLVVSQIGDGSGILTSAAQSVFLDQFTATGVAVNSLALPTADSPTGTATHALTDSGTASSDGMLTLSTDGQYLTYQGYDATPGVLSVAGTASAATARVVAVVSSAGVIDTTTALNSYTGNNIRSSALSGTTLYLGGSDSGTAPYGVRSATIGGTASTGLESNQSSITSVNLFGGSVYASTSTKTTDGGGASGGTLKGVFVVNGASPAKLSLVASDAAGNPADFFFADANTLYLADSSTTASGGGLQKYTKSGGTFSLAYTLTSGLTAGLRGLTGITVGGVTTLYAIDASEGTGGVGGNKLVAVTDAGATSAFVTLATAGTNEVFRGVDFAPVAAIASAPEPSGMVALAIGAGVLGLMVARRRKVAA